MLRKTKSIISRLNNDYFFGKYKETHNYINKESSIKEYIIKFCFVYILVSSFLLLIFTNLFYSFSVAFVLTIFFINEIMLNSKKLKYEIYILSQLTIYTSQMSLLVSFNNIYSSIKEVIRFMDYPLNKDLEKVVSNIDSGESITNSYSEFNEKYNNRTITLFNQTLELFNEHGDSDAGTVLHIISEEMNMLKIKKDKFLKFKKEWRLNFYVVVIMCMVMPIILKLMIPDIYNNYMNSFGSVVMIVIIFINLVIIKKIESIYRNQSIGEGGYR